MDQIERSKIAGLILRLLGDGTRGLCLNEAGLQVLGPSSPGVPFRDFAGPVTSTRRLWFQGVLLPLADGSSLRVLGVRREAAESFTEAVNAAWRRYVVELFDEIDPELRTLSQVVDRLSAPRRYPAACLLAPYMERVAALLSRLSMQVPGDFISPEQKQRLAAIAAFSKDPTELRDVAIETFIETELRETKAFLDSIESNPLTPEQRLAVVSDEDATLVLAGAGSGKTSVVVAKAAYLMRRGIRQPEEILLVAFGAKAAEEMACRIEARSGASVDARTFHALGLSIIKEAEGQAPVLAPHASDDVQFRALLRDILEQEMAQSEKAARLVLRWFSEFFGLIAVNGTSRPSTPTINTSNPTSCAPCKARWCAASRSGRSPTGSISMASATTTNRSTSMTSREPADVPTHRISASPSVVST